MNETRRKALRTIASELSDIQDRLNELAQEEQDYADAMPENMQGNDKHTAAEECASNLIQLADGELADVISQITDNAEGVA